MADTKDRQEIEQQLVYRIDCDKYPTIGGAPLVLVLQKESVKPILVILFGTQTYPSRTPVIKDQRKNKSQGYILQDERKLLPISPPASRSVSSAQSLPYLFSNCGPYQYQSMHHQQYPTDSSQGSSSFGQLSHDLSYNNQTIPWCQQQQHMFRDNPPLGSGNRPYAPPSFHNDDGMSMETHYGRIESMMKTQVSPFYSHCDRKKKISVMSMQQNNNNIPYAPWKQYTPTMQYNPAHQTSIGPVPPPPPAFRIMNGPRPSFTPLPGNIVV